MSYYVVEYLFSSDRRHLEARPSHREYLTGLQLAGRLVLSGPLADDGGALLVFRAADEAEVRELVDLDPYQLADVLDEVRILEWNPVLGYLAEHLED